MNKLYDDNAYAVEFDAVVLAAEEDADGQSVWLTLDGTLFFPEEGGQSPDRGMINDCAVTDVQIADGVIRHKVVCSGNAGLTAEETMADRHETNGPESESSYGNRLTSGKVLPGGHREFFVGSRVHGRIDWEYRYRNMQMHTGEHIFSGLVHSIFGYDNVGFHLSDRTATMDYNGRITEQQLHELEERANCVITENREVHAWYASEEELSRIAYRSKKAIDGAVRLVEIDGVDVCACCAPHVRYTGEVGCFKLIGWENYKGGIRVSYRCGFRAMEDYGERLALLARLSQLLSVKTEDLCGTVEKLQEERRRLAYELVAKDRAIARSRIEAAAAAYDSVPGTGRTGAAVITKLTEESATVQQAGKDGNVAANRTADGRIPAPCLLFFDRADVSLLRYIADEMKARFSGVVCAVIPADDTLTAWRYLIEQDGGDVSAWQQTLRERFGAKGGGPKNSVQGSVSAAEPELREVLEALSRES